LEITNLVAWQLTFIGERDIADVMMGGPLTVSKISNPSLSQALPSKHHTSHQLMYNLRKKSKLSSRNSGEEYDDDDVSIATRKRKAEVCTLSNSIKIINIEGNPKPFLIYIAKWGRG